MGGTISYGVECWGVKLNTHLHLVRKSRIEELYFQSPYVFKRCLSNQARGNLYTDDDDDDDDDYYYYYYYTKLKYVQFQVF
jgi:hypothetical protein